eukprot:gene3624-7215_t
MNLVTQIYTVISTAKAAKKKHSRAYLPIQKQKRANREDKDYNLNKAATPITMSIGLLAEDGDVPDHRRASLYYDEILGLKASFIQILGLRLLVSFVLLLLWWLLKSLRVGAGRYSLELKLLDDCHASEVLELRFAENWVSYCEAAENWVSYCEGC